MSHVTLLPPELAARSLSTRDLILSRADAEAAVTHLAASGRRIESWEGWVRTASGSATRSFVHTGSFALPLDVEGAARQVMEGIAAADARWARAPELEDATLYYGLVVAAG